MFLCGLERSRDIVNQSTIHGLEWRDDQFLRLARTGRS